MEIMEPRIKKNPDNRNLSPENNFGEMLKVVKKNAIKVLKERYPAAFSAREEEILKFVDQAIEEEQEKMSTSFIYVDKSNEKEVGEAIGMRVDHIVKTVKEKLDSQIQ